MPRRDDEHIQEGDEDRPPRRRPPDDEDDDDRPRRRREHDEDEDDEDFDRRRRRRLRHAEERRGGFLDDTFADTSIVVLVIFPVVCGLVALLFGILGVAICERAQARRNAWIVLVISICWMIAATVIVFLHPDLFRGGSDGRRI